MGPGRGEPWAARAPTRPLKSEEPLLHPDLHDPGTPSANTRCMLPAPALPLPVGGAFQEGPEESCGHLGEKKLQAEGPAGAKALR